MKLIQIMPAVLLAVICLTFETSMLEWDDIFDQADGYIPSSKWVTGKEYLYVGDTLRLNCTVPPFFTDQGYTASQIRFKKTYPRKESGSKPQCIDTENINISNQYTAQLVLPNMKELEAVELQCVLEPCDDSLTPNDTLVGSTSNDIKVQYKPQNVTNVTCILYNWNEDMKCTWQHPVQYIMTFKDTTVSCSYKTNSSVNEANPCPNLTFNGCMWKNIVENMTHTIQINVTNRETNDSSSTTFHVVPLNEVKPAAPKNINVQALGEDNCFNITWQYHDTQHSKKFNVFHQKSGDADWEIITSDSQEMFWKICGLKPFTTHNFSVICLSKYASDPSNFTYTTPQKAPLTGPEAINGSYTIEECNTQSQQRTITLFWKDVKEPDRNGVINRYIVSYNNLNDYVAKGNYKATLTINCTSQGETIQLFAENAAGVSVNPTLLTIAPNHTKVHSEVKESFSIEIINNSLVQAAWQTQNNSANFVVFWLRENSQEPIMWKPVPRYQSYIDISITDPLNYDFGLAMSGDNFNWTSPIEWTTCFHDSAPTSLPEFMDINIMPNEESAFITWEKIKCSKVNRFKITSYKILYCPEDKCKSSGDVLMVSVSAKDSSYTLFNLTAEKSYNLTINVDLLGVIRPWSKWKLFSTKSKFDGIDQMLLIILIPVVTVLCIFALCTLCLICKRSRQRMKTFKTNNEESVATTEENITKVLDSANGTNISTRPNISLNAPLISKDTELDHCEDSSEPNDSRRLLLNPSVQKSHSNGSTSIPMTDLSPSHALSPSSEDYSTITIKI